MQNHKDALPEGVFSDLLFAKLLAFIVITGLLFLLVNPIAKKADIEKVAQYIFEVNWPDEIDCDVDLWVRGPDGSKVSFRQKNNKYMHLERDDMGNQTDTIYHNGKPILHKGNSEIWTLRSKFDGEYLANLHVYACKGLPSGNKLGLPIDVPVVVKLIKLNPKYNMITRKKIRMTKIWQEKTALRFELSDEGSMYHLKDDSFETLIGMKRLPTPASGF